MSNQHTLLVNELFGPTIQGEGPDIGRPCFFLRLHGCSVQCPGCDTAYTWDGTEGVEPRCRQEIESYILEQYAKYPGAGLVVTGGEPLLYYKSATLHDTLVVTQHLPFVSLETSGFVGPQEWAKKQAPNEPAFFAQLYRFLEFFDRVVISPKITPCLHGKWTDEELTWLVPHIINHCQSVSTTQRWNIFDRNRVVLKFVVKEQNDLDVVSNYVSTISLPLVPIYIMPFGQKREEILEACEWLVEPCAKRGWILTPRLHSLMWGKRRCS